MGRKYNMYTLFFVWLKQKSRFKSDFNKMVSAAIFFVGLFIGNQAFMIVGVLYFLFDALFNQWQIYREKKVYEGWMRSQRQQEANAEAETVNESAQNPPETIKE